MWTQDKIEKLKTLFPNHFNKDIAIELDETLYNIYIKKKQLGLKKSEEFKTNVSKLGNKSRISNGGRDLNYENLKEIASKYKTRIDFIRGDEPAHQSARLKGWLNEICSHMTVIKFSIPQLILREITDTIFNTKASYNNRKVIKPYEIDVYYEDFKLGFEFQGIAWHKNNKNDVIKSNIATEKGIKIIYINEYNGSRDYEYDIKNQLIDNLLEINKLSKKNITKYDILNCQIKNIYLELYNKNELLNIAKGYSSFIEFKSKEKSIYRKLCKMKLVDTATAHMDDKIIGSYKFTDEYITSIVKNYDNLTDFRHQQLVLYKHIKQLNKDYLIKHLKRKPSYSIEEIILVMESYDSKTNFIKENPKMYKFIRRGELKYLLNKWN